MIKDKALEELFRAQKPMLDEQDVFMQKLEQKMETVEYIKRYEEENLRRYKYAVVIAFGMGIISGGVLLAFMLRTPMDTPLFTFNVDSGILFDIQQNSRIITSIALMLFMSYSVICIVNNILDITKTIKGGVSLMNR